MSINLRHWPASALLLLAACQPDPAENAAEANAASPPSANAAAAPEPADASNGPAPAPEGNAVGEATAAIPAAFHGTYDRDRAACASPSEERLRVEAGALRFHESHGDVRSVRQIGADAIVVEADFQGEGESWQGRLRLERGPGGELVVIQPEGARTTRISCG